jgi:glycerol-3-phosphate dehydrogenase
LLGTTDTPIAQAGFEPVPQADEVAYLLEHASRYLDRAPRESDILSRFAGLRPLIRGGINARTSKLSREHAVVVSDSGLVTITGGKWTTYRRMAQDTVDRAAQVGDLPRHSSTTEGLRLHGWANVQADTDPWLQVYGSDIHRLRAVIAERAEWNQILHPRLPFRVGEIIWAVRFEAARTVEDILARRLRALFLDARASLDSAAIVSELLGDELGRDADWKRDQVRAFTRICSDYLGRENPRTESDSLG